MARITFTPLNKSVEATADQKLLITARKNQIPLRFGCASCRCGTCGVKVAPSEAFHPMSQDEFALLSRMKLPTTGEVRLACQAKQTGGQDATIDLSFQDTYSPDDGDGDGSLDP
ncbi:MAG: 2Fe-2S iron-sulfur cluster-binding protein [bacterium]|jgi:ferredoxin